MASIFTKIIQGEIPSYKIAENEHCFAFLDIRPMKEGHTLCVPKREVDYYFDLTKEETVELSLFAREVAHAMASVIDCERIAMGVVGLEVPHAHVHLIPINTIGDFQFGKTEKVSQERMKDLSNKIAEAYSSL